MILVGTRSSLVVEYEETCKRCNREIEAALSFHPRPRLMNRSKAVDHAAFDASGARSGFVPCAFAPQKRRYYFERAVGMGLTPAAALLDPHSAVASTARIGEGSFVNAGAVIGALCMIGQGVLVNRNASIGHHCIVEDFVSIGPGATLASNIRLGEGVVIAAGATILPNVQIGSGAVIAAGIVVRSDVEPEMFMSGFPARSRRYNARRSSLAVEDEE